MNNNLDLKVLIVASEMAPFVKSGGLGDVIGSLPKALKKIGVDVRVVIPKFRNIKTELIDEAQFIDYFTVHLAWRNQSASIYELNKDFPIYFIENDYYFGRDGLYGYADDNERFAFFSKATIEMLPIIGFKPDVIHTNDWQTGPINLLIKDIYSRISFFSKIKTLFTIHNLQYQGSFSTDTLNLMELSEYYNNSERIEYYGQISYMKAGLKYSDVISTVSKTYADEIQLPHYGYGLDGVLRSRNDVLCGIINGIDNDENNPETDPRIYKNFGIDSIELKKENKSMLQKELGLPEKDVPMISIVSRLADQKGIDIVVYAIDELMKEDIQFVVLGTGDGRYEHIFYEASRRYPDKFSANIKFNGVLAQKIYAGSDMFLMPSVFEPCGLGQIISMRYGTVPIVRRTGGLADTVSQYNAYLKEGSGFVFDDYNAHAMIFAIRQALDLYNNNKDSWYDLVKSVLSRDFSWSKSAESYKKLYLNMKNKR